MPVVHVVHVMHVMQVVHVRGLQPRLAIANILAAQKAPRRTVAISAVRSIGLCGRQGASTHRIARCIGAMGPALSRRRNAAALSPALSGYMLSVSSFGRPLVVCGVLKVVHELTLLNLFQSVKPPEEEVTSADITK